MRIRLASITRTLDGNVEEIMGMLMMTTIENHHFHALMIKISTMCLLLSCWMTTITITKH